jgi:hypothetical protein
MRFGRFELTDAAQRSKEGSPFVSVDSEKNYQSSRPQGNRIIYLISIASIWQTVFSACPAASYVVIHSIAEHNLPFFA